MKVYYSKRYKRKYKKMDAGTQEVIDAALVLMLKDFSHPSLRIKKMKGYRSPNVWEASASMGLRITFEIEKPDTLILRNCGHHDETLNHP